MIYFKRYSSTTQIPSDWNALVTHDIFLQTSYLNALEKAAPKTICPYYKGVFNDGVLAGIAVIQRVELYAKDMFRSESTSKPNAIFRDSISRILKGNILVVGNLTHTGQHGLYFDSAQISQNKFLDLLFEAIEDLKIHIKRKNNKTIRAILFKDYFQDDGLYKSAELFEKQQLYHLNVQPNMVLQIRSYWHSFEEYLNDLNKKYKTRFKRARKKLVSISVTELTEKEVFNNSERLDQLYNNVSNKASFNTFVLPKEHFYNLKQHLGDNFRLFAYYLNDDIVGFYTFILNRNTLETYFLGYDDSLQHDKQLYLNMLYDMIAFGIENNFKSIVFARTAMEIKSSVGAIPKPMSMFIKHTNPVINTLLKSIFKVMNPEQKWEERHPFKMEDNS